MEDQLYQSVISRLQVNDAGCIGLLYDHYGDALYGIVLRIVKDEQAATDCLQEIFIKIWKNGHQYDDSKSRLFTWMSRIARNSALNLIESKDFRNHNEIQKVDNLVHIDTRSGHQLNEETTDLRGIVDKLEGKYRDIIEWVYFKGYTQKEISEEMGIPLGTVKTRVKGALRQLRDIYEHKAEAIAIIIMITGGIMI